MSGALHLTSALACATLKRADDTASYLNEAQRIARTIPADAADVGLVYFGVDNIGIWRVSTAVELGEAGKVAEIARTRQSGRRAFFGTSSDLLRRPWPRLGGRPDHP